jgi:cell division transport system permease protein
VARKQNTYFLYAIFGIALVLFVLGIGAFLIIEAQRASASFKENLVVEVVLKDNTDGAESINALQTLLKGKAYTKTVKYVSKAEAAKILQKDLGEDFLDVLGYNPLYASFVLNLNADYANKASFKTVQADLIKIEGVQQVNVQAGILESLDTDVRKASLIVFVIAIILLIFAISLIFNTIRLAMFSNRFTIKTMQLFGATKWFVIKPFLGRGLVNGFAAGILASLMLGGLIYYLDYVLPELGINQDLITFALLFGAIILFGVIISFFSTLVAVLRYLRMQLDDLY